MNIRKLFIGLTSTLIFGCNYRVFDLVQYPEISSKNPIKEIGQKVTEPSFDSIYKTIIEPKCLRCHSPGGKAELVPLDRLQDLLNPLIGDPLLIPGDPEKSQFYKVLLPETVKKKMPPIKSGIDPVEPIRLEVIKNWILNGAPELNN